MKIAAIAATVAALTLVACKSTEAEAAEIGSTGISIGAELDNRFNVDDGDMTVTLTPSLGYDLGGLALSADMDVILYDHSFTWNNDELPTLDFGAEYGLGLWGLSSTAYIESGYDLEAESMSDVEVGISFKF